MTPLYPASGVELPTSITIEAPPLSPPGALAIAIPMLAPASSTREPLPYESQGFPKGRSPGVGSGPGWGNGARGGAVALPWNR